MFISPAAVMGLELASLFATIDKTFTPMGKRRLRYWLYHPLKEKNAIVTRQKAVSLLREKRDVRDSLAGLLKNLPDIEKNLSKISCGYAHPGIF